MKIAISELEPQEISDIDSTTGEAIVGGETSVTIFAESLASGDLTVTRSGANVYSFEYETDSGVYSVSLGLGYAFSFSFEANSTPS